MENDNGKSKTIKNKIAIVIFSLLLLIIFCNLLRLVFAGEWILPQYFTLGPLTIHYYGITMALAVGSGWWLAMRRASKFGIDPAKADGFLTWLVLGGFVGARLYHVASSWQYYWQYPLDAFKVWNGGLSIYGALLGGVIVVLCAIKFSSLVSNSEVLRVVRQSNASGQSEIATSSQNVTSRNDTIFNYQFSIINILDWLTPSVLLGQIIGRFGNWFNYEAFGYPTSLPWGMFVPEAFRPVGLTSFQYFHPLFLYEALGNLCILVFLMNLHRSNKSYTTYSTHAPGVLFFMYLFLYNTLRFALEHLRIDSTFIQGVFRLNALVSGVLLLVGILGMYLVTHDRNSKKNKLGEP